VHVAAEFLAQRQRHGVHHVRAAHLDDGFELGGLPGQHVAQVAQRRQQAVVHFARGGDVHGGGEGVVGRLALVDVVVRVNRLLGTEFAAGHLDGAIGDHLVHVHVALGAGAGLPHHQREVVVEPAGGHFRGGAGDQVGLVLRHQAELGIGQGSGLLEDAERVHHFQGHALALAADGEELQAARGLGAPVAVAGDFEFTHGVAFDADRHCRAPMLS
jgi:hypothetical protein